jgi:hypothetical protein
MDFCDSIGICIPLIEESCADPGIDNAQRTTEATTVGRKKILLTTIPHREEKTASRNAPDKRITQEKMRGRFG